MRGRDPLSTANAVAVFQVTKTHRPTRQTKGTGFIVPFHHGFGSKAKMRSIFRHQVEVSCDSQATRESTEMQKRGHGPCNIALSMRLSRSNIGEGRKVSLDP